MPKHTGLFQFRIPETREAYELYRGNLGEVINRQIARAFASEIFSALSDGRRYMVQIQMPKGTTVTERESSKPLIEWVAKARIVLLELDAAEIGEFVYCNYNPNTIGALGEWADVPGNNGVWERTA